MKIIRRTIQQFLAIAAASNMATAQGGITGDTAPSYNRASDAEISLTRNATPAESMAVHYGQESSQEAQRPPATTPSTVAVGGDSTRRRTPGAPIEEVIVTAQKREENLQDVPIAISVLGSERLEAPAIVNLKDALRSVPGVTAYEQGQSGGLSKYAVRGVGSNASLFNGGSTIGVYLDEIPFGFVRFPVSPDPSAYDLERVEVLRGPQGTLYGASSLNGVVRILTADADLYETQGKTRLGFSSTEHGESSYRTDAALSVPLIPGKLAARAVAGYADLGGWIDYPLRGKDDANYATQKNFRLKFNAAPAENFNAELATWLFRDDRGAWNIAFDDRTYNADQEMSSRNEFDAAELMLTYDFPAFTVTSSTSYLDFESGTINDVGPLLFTDLASELIAQELRLNSTGKSPWQWILGGLYRDAEDHRVQSFLPRVIPSTGGISDNIFASRSYAVYGDLTRALFNGHFEVTGGLRYFHDTTSSNELGAFVVNPDGSPVVPFGKKTDTFDAWTSRFVMAFKPGELTNYYASYSQGFRSGFSIAGDVLRNTPFVLPGVKPDRLNNYELGVKGRTAGGALNYDLAVYYIDWRDTIQAFGTLLPGTTAQIFNAVNSEAIKGAGVDVGVVLKLSPHLEIGATVSWNDLHFSDDVLAQGPTGPVLIYPRDSRPAESPERTAGVVISYTIPFGNSLSGHWSGSLDYASRQVGTGSTGTTAEGNDINQYRASFALESERGWIVTVFGDNLTDDDGRIRQTIPGLFGVSDRLRPRTYGVQLDYRF